MARARAASAAATIEDARAAAFEAFLAEERKNKTGTMVLSSTDVEAIEAIPTGILSLDYALGVGGFPRGRIIELFGKPMSGKTTLALAAAAQTQKEGNRVGIVDAEHALSMDHVAWMGMNPDLTVTNAPDSGEEGLATAERMLKSGAFSMVIVDSVAALVPRKELEGELNDSQGLGLHARMMSQALRRLGPAAGSTNTTLVFINQVRTNLGAYGAPDTTTGGKALPFYASVRIKVVGGETKASKIERNGEIVGQHTVAEIVKNKVAPPWRKANYDLYYGVGFAEEAAVIEVALGLGLIENPVAGSFVIGLTGEKIRGKDNLVDFLSADPELLEALKAQAWAVIRAPKDPAAAAPAVSVDSEEDGYDFPDLIEDPEAA